MTIMSDSKRLTINVPQDNKNITFGVILATRQKLFASLPYKIYKLTCNFTEFEPLSNSK